jgi:hypothetical protein
MRDVADGLWLWRQPHPDWRDGFDWEPQVASFAAESRGAAVVLDPLAPPPGARDVWARLDALRPEAVVILKPDHVRDVDLFVRWYAARAYGPNLFWRHDIPHTELEPVRPGDELPGGLQAHHDGRGEMETPIYLPRAAGTRLRRRDDRAGRRAAHMGDAVARGAHAPGAAGAADVAVRARARVPRRAGARAL